MSAAKKPSAQPASRPGRRFGPLRGCAVVLAVLAGLWLLLALALPPTLIKRALQDWLVDTLNAPVTVKDIRLNPFTLQATLTGLSVPSPALAARQPQAAGPEHSGEPPALLSVERLIVTPGLRLVSRSVAGNETGGAEAGETDFWTRLKQIRPQVVVSLRVERPDVDIAYLGDGLFSFSHLLPPSPPAPPDPAEPTDPADLADLADPALPGPPEPTSEERFSFFTLSDMSVADGTFILRDALTGTSLNLESVQFDVPFIAPSPSLLSGQSPAAEAPPLAAPTLSATLNGVPVQVTGSIQPYFQPYSQPYAGATPERGAHLRTTFDIRAGTLDMGPLGDFLSRFTPLKLVSGRLEPTLTFALSRSGANELDVELSGQVHVEDLDLAGPSGESAAKLKRGEIAVAGFTLSERRISLRAMELDGLYIKATRGKDGRLDWQDWIEKLDAGQAAGSPPAPAGDDASFVVEGADLTLRNADFVWEDAAFTGTGRITVSGVDGRIAEYSTRPGARTAMRLSFGIDNEGMLALEGEGALSPPSLQASLQVRDLSLVVLHPLLGGTPFSDVLGRLDFTGTVQSREQDGVSHAVINKAEAAVRELSFGKNGKGGKTPAFSARSLTFKGLSLDSAAQKVELETLSVSGPKIRLASGTAAMGLDLPAARETSPAQNGAQNAAKTPWGGSAAWKAAIGAFRVDKGQISRVDAKGKTEVLVSDLSLSTGALSLDPRQRISFTLRSKGRSNDNLEASGDFRPSPLDIDARVKASGLELDTLDTFLRPWTGVALSGQAEGDLRVGVQAASGKPPAVELSGNLTLRNTRLADRQSGRNLGRFRRFSAQGLMFSSARSSLQAAQLLLDQVRLPLEIDSKGNLTLLDILTRRTSLASPPMPVSADPLAGILASLSIASFRVQDSAFFLSDKRFTPPVALTAQNLNAVVTTLSNARGTSAEVSISAQLDGAPVRLSGRTNPLIAPPTADLVLKAEDVDLSRYSPYARQYMGYPVEQGRLSLESRIRTSNRDFSADSTLALRGLTLGPRDTRSQAPDYPVTLGLSLLSDLNGDVNINVPLRGSLDGVDLQMGGIVGKAVGGLFAKILSSPFTLVGGIFGFLGESEPELQLLPFFPGSSALFQASNTRVDKVVDLLRLRPKTKARLVGVYEPQADEAGLRREAVRRRLRELKHASLPASQRDAIAPDAVRIAPEEYEDLLFTAFKAADVPKTRNLLGMTRREDPDVMERRLSENERVTRADLEALARARAESVRARILKLDPSLAGRVSLGTGRDGAPEVRTGAARVEIELR